jgi:hypothetical protein
MPAATSPSPAIDIEGTSLDHGGHILIKRALQDVATGARLGVIGRAPDLAVHLIGWGRAQGHGFTFELPLSLSTAGAQASLKTLFEEPEFAVASFLLSVLGEGTFVSLLHFLAEHAPDPVTRQIAKLSARDEARHVAFEMAHLQYHLRHDQSLQGRLAQAVKNRHDALSNTSGLNEEVFDALVLLAAGDWTPRAIESGFANVQALKQDMAQGRQLRLNRLGFSESDAELLSNLHTRNFM